MPQEEASPTAKIVEITDTDEPALANEDEDVESKGSVSMTAAERQREKQKKREAKRLMKKTKKKAEKAGTSAAPVVGEEELAKKKVQEAMEWQEKFKQMINRLAMQEALNSSGSLTSKSKESKTHKFWDTQPVPRLGKYSIRMDERVLVVSFFSPLPLRLEAWLLYMSVQRLWECRVSMSSVRVRIEFIAIDDFNR